MSKKLLFILFFICSICMGCERQYGELTQQTRGNFEYTTITSNFPLEIQFSKYVTELITITHEELQPDVKLLCENGCLFISIDKLYNKSWDITPQIIMPLPTALNSIQGYSALKIEADTTISTSQLQLNLAGNSQVHLDLDVESLEIKSLGYGTTLVLSGVADKVNVESNSLVMSAFDMKTNIYICEIYSSQLDIQCSDSLIINNMNNSILRYKGNCDVLQNNVWSSTIQQID